MSDPFLAEIIIFAGNFAPRGWAFCEGQLLPISQNQALFSLLGTIYGGDGRTTFGLPDLRGRLPIGPRSGPGLSTYKEGQKGGVEQVVLNTAQIPSHNHDAKVGVANGAATLTAATNNALGNQAAANVYDVATDVTTRALGGVSQANAGGNLQHTNIQPYLAINYIIALVGTFPSRN